LEYWKDSKDICGNIECVEGFCVKRQGYNYNFGGTQGWKCKMVADSIIVLEI
jgi:hypothetical protein